MYDTINLETKSEMIGDLIEKKEIRLHHWNIELKGKTFITSGVKEWNGEHVSSQSPLEEDDSKKKGTAL